MIFIPVLCERHSFPSSCSAIAQKVWVTTASCLLAKVIAKDKSSIFNNCTCQFQLKNYTFLVVNNSTVLTQNDLTTFFALPITVSKVPKIHSLTILFGDRYRWQIKHQQKWNTVNGIGFPVPVVPYMVSFWLLCACWYPDLIAELNCFNTASVLNPSQPWYRTDKDLKLLCLTSPKLQCMADWCKRLYCRIFYSEVLAYFRKSYEVIQRTALLSFPGSYSCVVVWAAVEAGDSQP